MSRKFTLNMLCKSYLLLLDREQQSAFAFELKQFHDNNSNLTDVDFFEKFHVQFPQVELTNKALNVGYLSRIAKNTEVLKIIAIIYLVASAIAAILLLGS